MTANEERVKIGGRDADILNTLLLKSNGKIYRPVCCRPKLPTGFNPASLGTHV